MENQNQHNFYNNGGLLRSIQQNRIQTLFGSAAFENDKMLVKGGPGSGRHKTKIDTDDKGIHSVEHKGSKYWSKPGEEKDAFKQRIKTQIKDDHKNDVDFDDDNDE